MPRPTHSQPSLQIVVIGATGGQRLPPPPIRATPAVAEARTRRTQAAANLVRGSTNQRDLDDYIRWISASLLLADITHDEAEESLARAHRVLAANIGCCDSPNDLERRIDLDTKP